MSNFTKSILYSATVLAVGLVAIYTIYDNVSSSPDAQIAGMEPAAGEDVSSAITFNEEPAAGEEATAEDAAVSPVQETIDAAAQAAENGQEAVEQMIDPAPEAAAEDAAAPAAEEAPAEVAPAAAEEAPAEAAPAAEETPAEEVPAEAAE